MTPIERAAIGQVPTDPVEQLEFARALCESLGLNYMTQPFQFIVLDGRMVCYATKACTDQLRAKFGVSITKMTMSEASGVYTVMVEGANKDGRQDIATGSVATMKDGKPLNPHDLADALMTAETKAKRRLTLSICGLGMLDETEIPRNRAPSGPDDKPIVEMDLNLLKGSWRKAFAGEESDKAKLREQFAEWVNKLFPLRDPHDWREYTCAQVLELEKLCYNKGKE